MGLLTLIQISCHHVLANEIALNLKYRIGLKHFFNINLGIGIIEKTTYFCLYFRHISPCYYSNFDRESSLDAELNSTSNEYPLSILLINPAAQKIRNTLKNVMMMSSSHFFRDFLFLGQRGPSKVCHHHIFQVFLIFGAAGSIKSMQCRYLLDVELNSASNKLSRLKFE